MNVLPYFSEEKEFILGITHFFILFVKVKRN